MSLEIVGYGFNGARAANVPSNIPEFAKQASWSPLFCAVVLGYCLLSHKAEDPLTVVTSVVCTVCSMVPRHRGRQGRQSHQVGIEAQVGVRIPIFSKIVLPFLPGFVYSSFLRGRLAQG